jgi:hypothetical protein
MSSAGTFLPDALPIAERPFCKLGIMPDAKKPDSACKIRSQLFDLNTFHKWGLIGSRVRPTNALFHCAEY